MGENYDGSSIKFLNQMEYNLFQNRKVNCHLNHIPFNLKENEFTVFLIKKWKNIEKIE